MKKVFKEDSQEYKLWSEIINDIYLEFDTTNDASKADDLTNKLKQLIDLISLPVEVPVMPNEVLADGSDYILEFGGNATNNIIHKDLEHLRMLRDNHNKYVKNTAKIYKIFKQIMVA